MNAKIALSINELETILRNAKKLTKKNPNFSNGKNIATVILSGDTKKSLIAGEFSIDSQTLTMATPYSDSDSIAALLAS